MSTPEAELSTELSALTLTTSPPPPPKKKQTTFFSLAPELRLPIYASYFASLPTPTKRADLKPALLRTHPLIRREALPLWLDRLNEFSQALVQNLQDAEVQKYLVLNPMPAPPSVNTRSIPSRQAIQSRTFRATRVPRPAPGSGSFNPTPSNSGSTRRVVSEEVKRQAEAAFMALKKLQIHLRIEISRVEKEIVGPN